MFCDYISTSTGILKICTDDEYLLSLDFVQYEEKGTSNYIMEEVKKQLQEYFNHKRTEFKLPIKFTRGTDFQQKVWNALKTIPYGKTISYKELATLIGNPKACRAVGNANNKNPISIIIPCHRVIGTNGSLVGYGGGLHNKDFLINHEKSLG